MKCGARALRYPGSLCLVGMATVVYWWAGGREPRHAAEAGRPAAIYPDYAGIVIPPGIAPLNFKIREGGSRYYLRISSPGGPSVAVSSGSGDMRIPAGAWRKLLAAVAGDDLRLDVYAAYGGEWRHFDTIHNRIASEDIDPYVVYRYIPPIYNKWDRIQLVQRNLRGFEERLLFDTVRDIRRDSKSAGTCIHCHTFLNHGTERMLLQTRPGDRTAQSPAMILVENGRARRVDTRNGGPPAAYSSWHPDGKLVVFSRNRISQMFHTAGVESREVIDIDSDLGLYEVDTGRMYTIPQISRPDRLETFPAWSADGRHLYFTSAPAWTDSKHPSPVGYDKVRYDLDRIAYDSASRRWGEVETVVAAAQLGRSISLPQPSPDGRFIMFCGHDYGSFPVFQPSSDLYLLDLEKGRTRRLDEIDSPSSESYHFWSSNSRWVIFASKREDGIFGRLYITHLDADGRFSKPFVLPQEDPGFNSRCLMTFNRPEFVSEPVTVTAAELARAMDSGVGEAPTRNAGVQQGVLDQRR